MTQLIQIFDDEKWTELSVNEINNYVLDVCEKKGFCNFMLTGGSSAYLIYNFWADLISLDYPIYFYFGDERCVLPDDSESNYFMVKNSLFKHGIPSQFQVERIYGEADDYEMEIKRYEAVLPNEMDVLLLSIGEDTHIASIFPGDTVIHKDKNRFALVKGSKPPNPRITITPKFISTIGKIFCLARGDTKSDALNKVFKNTGNPKDFPAKLVVNCNWLIDKSAAEIMEKMNRS